MCNTLFGFIFYFKTFLPFVHNGLHYERVQLSVAAWESNNRNSEVEAIVNQTVTKV